MQALVTIPELKAVVPELPIDSSLFASIVVVDSASGKILYKKELTKAWPAASLTKLMTTVVFTSTPTKWDGTANILSKDEVEGGRLNVPAGTKLSFRDLLYSAIVGSANNCANALARWFDGRGVPAFVEKMNARAKLLGLEATNFVDASGISPKNMTTAYDIAVLLNDSSRDAEIQKAMTTPAYAFATRGPVVQKNVKNTNDMLFTNPDIIVTAGKTGYLIESKYNYVVRVHPKTDASKRLIIVVLGADSRKAGIEASASLATWAWGAFDWRETPGTAIAENYRQGDKGEDVKRLQQFLNANGAVIAATGPGSSGKETTLFGPLTAAALKKFQDSHKDDVLTPFGRTSGSGSLDFATRYLIQTYASK